MSRSPSSVSGAVQTSPGVAVAEHDPPIGGDVYTMAEAARLKGVSYHTVSRAVRRGKLPSQRLGRMALITADDLRDWRPMRERAPHRYRRIEPDPSAAPALLDLASGERVDLARRLSTLYEILHGAATALPLPEFLALLADRLASALDFRRVAIWEIDSVTESAERLATFGPAFGEVLESDTLADSAFVRHLLTSGEPAIINDAAEITDATDEERDLFAAATPFFVMPLRVGDRPLGFVLCDCNGDAVSLSSAQLVLADGLANHTALALERAQAQNAVSSPAEQLAAMLEHVSDAVFAADANGWLTVVNGAARQLFGVSGGRLAPGTDLNAAIKLVERRELDGRPVPHSKVPLLRAVAGERVEDRRHIIVRPDGTERMVSVHAEPIFDPRGQRAGAMAIVRDITVEQAMAASDAERVIQLEAAADRAAAVAEIALAVNSGTDLEAVLQTTISRMTNLLGGRNGAIFFQEADGRMTGQVGYRFTTAAEGMEIAADALPTTLRAFAQRAPLYYTYDDAVPSERVYFEQLGFQATTIVPLIVGDEMIGVAYVNYDDANHAPSDENLRFVGALANQCAVAIDKTRLMNRMESAHQRLLAVIDQLPQGVVITEAPDGRIALANRAAEALWGGSLTDRHGTDLGLINGDGSRFAEGDDPIASTLRTGRGRYGERLMLSRLDGSQITVLTNHGPILDASGQIVGAISVLQDSAQLRALDEAKDEFLSIAAHELRNPLTSLHGNLQLLLRRVQKDPERDEEATRLRAIIAQSDRLAGLVNRLLDVSRAELGRLDLTMSATDASSLINRVVENARGLSPDHQIVADVSDQVAVIWDEMRIEQVLTNLISNAVNHTPGGEIRVTATETDDEQVQIAVRDEGPGIPETAKVDLFDRYFRRSMDSGKDGTSSNGLGLGLYISRVLARIHGGDLTVADAPGGGAVFVLRLPREATAPRAGDRVPTGAVL